VAAHKICLEHLHPPSLRSVVLGALIELLLGAALIPGTVRILGRCNFCARAQSKESLPARRIRLSTICGPTQCTDSNKQYILWTRDLQGGPPTPSSRTSPWGCRTPRAGRPCMAARRPAKGGEIFHYTLPHNLIDVSAIAALTSQPFMFVSAMLHFGSSALSATNWRTSANLPCTPFGESHLLAGVAGVAGAPGSLCHCFVHFASPVLDLRSTNSRRKWHSQRSARRWRASRPVRCTMQPGAQPPSRRAHTTSRECECGERETTPACACPACACPACARE
jgi:hypothetical protein